MLSWSGFTRSYFLLIEVVFFLVGTLSYAIIVQWHLYSFKGAYISLLGNP